MWRHSENMCNLKLHVETYSEKCVVEGMKKVRLVWE